MSVTLVDTNILLDIVTDDPVWAGWSLHQLDLATIKGKLAIKEVIYAELSVRFAEIEEVEAMLIQAGIELLPIPRPALFLAAKLIGKRIEPGLEERARQIKGHPGLLRMVVALLRRIDWIVFCALLFVLLMVLREVTWPKMSAKRSAGD